MPISYKCPNCAANLQFDPDAKRMVCNFCGSEMYPEDVIEPESGRNEQSAEDWQDETEIYSCGSCGAEVIVGKDLSATFCAFCGSPTIISSHYTGGTKPTMIIPFSYGREEAEKEFKKWCAGKVFLPRKFKSRASIEKLTPMYVPFWLYDYQVDINMVIINYTIRDVPGTDDKPDKKEMGAFECRKRGPLIWEKVPIVASRDMSDIAVEMIEPFNYSKAKPFEMKYMAGFFAQRCAYSDKNLIGKIRERIKSNAKDAVMDSFDDEHLPVSADDYSLYPIPDSEFALLPVWFLTYTQGKRKYVFLLNGQTGSVAGEIPVSPVRIGLLALGLSAVILPVLYFLGGLLL
jgi:DNA-directed RNA polymerase subunit RPC12/RpoP